MGKTWKHHPNRPRKARAKKQKQRKIPGLATDKHPGKVARSLRREKELVEEANTHIPTGRK